MSTVTEPEWAFELEPFDEPVDETSFVLRAHFDRMDDNKLRQYSPGWTDEHVMEWDGNFKADGELLLPCTEREVDVTEYRRVLHQCIAYRDRVRPTRGT